MFNENEVRSGLSERDTDPYADLGEMHVQRRFPIGPFLWIIGGLVVAAFIGMVVLNAYLKSGYGALSDLGYAYLIAVAGLGGTIYYMPTLWAFLFGPRPFVIGMDGFQFGARRAAFNQIAGLRHDAGRATTHVLMSDGSRFRLRWPIWHDSEFWVSLLEHRSHPYLMTRALAEAQAGQRVTFGRMLALDRTTIHVGRRSFPLAAVTDFHFIDGTDNGDDFRKLKIRISNKEYVIDERKIENPKIFTDLFLRLVDPGSSSSSL
jgi:hypothetical protein